MRVLVSLFGVLTVLGVAGAIAAVAVVLWGLHHYGRGLPDYAQLADYEPPTLTRLHAGDGRLLAEYASEQRVFVPIDAIPKLLIKAFISAEDKNFYDHHGVDLVGILRAAIQNVRNLANHRRLIGASTITQQVAKNFLLSNEVSIERKIREALLAIRIERALSKDRILELYLNQIFLGQRSYGVAAAAMNYFDKSLDDLTLSEAAFLAALPKAPNNYNPERHPKAALARRNYVLRRMHEDGFIPAAALRAASAEPIVTHRRDRSLLVKAPFFSEEVRREIAERYGEDALYRGGLSVRTTLDPRLQEIATRALRQGLIAYDRRHGWRGPVARIGGDEDWFAQLARVPPPDGIGDWRLAVVLDVTAKGAAIGLADRHRGQIPFAEMAWARPWRENQRVGPAVTRADQVLRPGDVVAVEALPANEGDAAAGAPVTFGLRQIPDVQGAIVAMDPHTGRVLAMVGGWSFEGSQFNRAVQALRQPGSAFKPFVYLAALESGYTPASLVLDAPFVLDQGPGLGLWKPENYGHNFAGPAPLRVGIEKSRNLMTVRLASRVGMAKILNVAKRFAIGDYPPNLSIALGAGETSLTRLTTAYAMLVNGGKRIAPALIERIQDRHGRTIYRRDHRRCVGCTGLSGPEAGVPRLPDEREQVTDPASAFQITWLLKGVVDRGTGRRIASLGRPLAGKTGTTNDSFDTWFIGFSPDLVAGVFVGFDNPRTLGPRQTGSNVAAPIFKACMAAALDGQPPVPFRIPRGIRMVRIDGDTGLLPGAMTERVILEAFKPGTEPTTAQMVGASAFGESGAPGPNTVGFDSGLY